MDERMARRLAGEAMAELCREFGISRKTGYKIFDRYQECGIQGLTDRSRGACRYANQLPFHVENFILNVKHEQPQLGRSQDPRAFAPALLGDCHPCQARSSSRSERPCLCWPPSCPTSRSWSRHSPELSSAIATDALLFPRTAALLIPERNLSTLCAACHQDAAQLSNFCSKRIRLAAMFGKKLLSIYAPLTRRAKLRRTVVCQPGAGRPGMREPRPSSDAWLSHISVSSTETKRKTPDAERGGRIRRL